MQYAGVTEVENALQNAKHAVHHLEGYGTDRQASAAISTVGAKGSAQQAANLQAKKLVWQAYTDQRCNLRQTWLDQQWARQSEVRGKYLPNGCDA